MGGQHHRLGFLARVDGCLKRLEIWTASGGPDYAGKPRPVVILQDERIPTESVTICGLTSTPADVPFYRPVVGAGDRTGLR